MKLIQVQFYQKHPSSTRYQMAWVDIKWKLKKGDQVTFVGEKDRWTVQFLYSIITEETKINKKWGLALPKSQRTER